ncbi:MAG TPA: arginine--tRNA ligase [Terrimicrobiaceae bacterium]|nr:arginine--tRNA ligase [Terrimicrobiaceae bacterium]
MATAREILAKRLKLALEKTYPGAGTPEVVPATDPRFGDYQTNVAMVLAKELRMAPRSIAAEICRALDVRDLSDPPQVAGAGFINFRLTNEFVARSVSAIFRDDRLGVSAATKRRRIIIDFSSPNVAKPMHVGHIRSTILGDCLARTARFLGHDVITDNHVGDWGTQFGKVIYGWKHLLDRRALESNAIHELVRLYREVSALEDNDDAIRRAVREELVKLQQGDPDNRKIWSRAVELSWRDFQKLYDLLGVRFDERLGESFYSEALAPLCEKLAAQGVAEMSEGALCIFFRDIPALADKPLIIRKSDGGFLYATTDLATIEYRTAKWNPSQIWYVVGAPQSLHFQQIFAAARRIGVTAKLEHIAFGSILGEDRKIMRTRAGETIGLAELLEEAIDRAGAIVAERKPPLERQDAEEIALAIGLGAVKYAELSQHRMTDYVFSWDKLLSFQGNTAPYLQNAYVRIRSIFRRLDQSFDAPEFLTLKLPEERVLAVRLLQFGEIVPLVLEDFRPNLLASYLYDVAIGFHVFYEACPVLKADGPDLRNSRLVLCDVTARVLRAGLGLLGIDCPERM